LANWADWPKKLMGKVENILKGSLDSIGSPSVKIQIWAGKFASSVKANIPWRCQLSLLTSPCNVLPYYLK
jgi:hypothetical protein